MAAQRDMHYFFSFNIALMTAAVGFVIELLFTDASLEDFKSVWNLSWRSGAWDDVILVVNDMTMCFKCCHENVEFRGPAQR